MRVEWSAAHACEVFRGQAELGRDFFVRNALATVERSAGSGDLTSFFIRDRFIVNGSVGETVSYGIGHHFEQVNDGGNLAGSQPLDEIVSLLQLYDILPINNALLMSRSTTDSIPCVRIACRWSGSTSFMTRPTMSYSAPTVDHWRCRSG
jgi:hypothetical protein